MTLRAVRLFLPALMVCQASAVGAAVTAAGRNWQISIDRIECEAAASRVLIGTRIRYLGPRGLVEAPISRLADGSGKGYPPRSLVWRSGSKQLAAWLSAGGLRSVQADEAGEVQFRFEVGEGSKVLAFEFGDVQAVALSRAGISEQAGVCANLLKPGQIRTARKAPPARVDSATTGARVYRGAYPCLPPSKGAWRTMEAQHPPYLPEQLLVFGRGYLPNARQIELPMGKAAAQSYSYAGAEELDAIEAVARRAVQKDFPHYAGAGYFPFNWGAQASASGNRIYSIGIYAIRPCPT